MQEWTEGKGRMRGKINTNVWFGNIFDTGEMMYHRPR